MMQQMNALTKEMGLIDPDAHPLFERLKTLGFENLTEADLDAFLVREGLKMAVFAEDPNDKKVTLDIAVIAPELAKLFGDALAARAFADTRQGRALAGRWGMRRLPAVALFRGETYLGAVEGLKNWDEYCTALAEIARREKAPARVITLQNANETPSCHD